MNQASDPLQDAIFRQRLRETLGLDTGEQVNPKTVALILKRKRLSSILKNQMRESGLGDLAAMTRFRRGGQ